jgi:hypothetical protein
VGTGAHWRLYANNVQRRLRGSSLRGFGASGRLNSLRLAGGGGSGWRVAFGGGGGSFGVGSHGVAPLGYGLAECLPCAYHYAYTHHHQQAKTEQYCCVVPYNNAILLVSFMFTYAGLMYIIRAVKQQP